MRYYLFPKCFQHYSLEQMMEAVARVGYDGPTALIRDGFWISRQQAAKDLPAYIKTAQANGLRVEYGSADINLDTLKTDSEQLDLLKIFAANGIKQVRMQHVGKREQDDVFAYAQRFRRQAENAAWAGEQAGLQCIIQIHGVCYPHNATAAYEGVCGLDSRYVGIKLDPGNNVCQEGYELFWYQIRLLKDYIFALGAKDVGYFRNENAQDPNKGWHPRWLPGYEGMINYQNVFSLLKQIGFQGPVIGMPFYAFDSDCKMEKAIAKELAYFKSCNVGDEA